MVDQPHRDAVDASTITDAAVATAAASAPRGQVLRMPSAEDMDRSAITALMRWLAANRSITFSTYDELWQWSVREPEQFWAALWEYLRIDATTPYETVRRGETIQDAVWFPGARLNFAQHLLRHEKRLAGKTALICHREDGSRADWTWSQLGIAVRQVATGFRAMGLGPGDRIVAYMPNVVEAAVAMLAATAIGAIWSSCSPEFGAGAAIDRFGQIAPKLLIAAPEYRYASNDHDRRAVLNEIVEALPSLEQVVTVWDEGDWLHAPRCRVSPWSALAATPAPAADVFEFEAVATDHPLWVVYTSGTSGPPKAIVHSHAGALLGGMKDLGFHVEVGEDSVLFLYCTTSWIVWNLMLVGLSLGSSVVLYDGSPFHPDIGRLWAIAEQSGATIFGTSPGFVVRLIEKSFIPADHQPLTRLDVIVLAGAVADDATWSWLTGAIPPHTRIISQAGSTEICGGYAGGVRILPSRAGEISARMLGMDVEALDAEGRPVRGQPGELVIRSPFPNAPLCLWNDPGGARFYENYLREYQGRWRQGDIITIFDDGSCRVSGRSDATIKRHGVRMGTNEIYRALSRETAVADSIAVCPQTGRFGGKLVLFVQTVEGRVLDEALKEEIAVLIAGSLSPRHVPDVIVEAPAVPYTSTGKRLEVPLRQLLEGCILPDLFASSLQHDRDTGDWFAEFAGHMVPTGDL